MSTKRKILLIFIPLFLVFTIGFGFATTAKAVEFDEDGIIEVGEVIDDDLFIGNDTVEINGTINGDVFAGGSVVTVNGTINGSLIAGAQALVINGKINGSVYAIASTLTLKPEAEIGRNLFHGGINLAAEEGSVVKRDLLVGAYQALLSGEVGRDVQAGVGALEINGSIGNDVIAEVGGTSNEQPFIFTGSPGVETIVPFGIRISEEATIGGSLNYKSSENQSENIAIIPPGGIDFEYSPEMDTYADPEEASRVGSTTLVATWLLKQARVFITLMLLGGLIVWQIPGILDNIGGRLEKEALPSFGWGLVTILVVHLGSFLAGGLIIASAIFFGVITLGELAWVILTVGFLSLGIIMTGFGLLLSYGSKLVVAYIVGKLLIKWLAPNYQDKPIWSMLLGVFIYTFLRAIPFGFGFVIGVIVTLVGIGVIWLTYRDKGLPGFINGKTSPLE